MAQDKDAGEKLLEDYNEVFADVVNNFLFGGREVVLPQELESAPVRSQLKLEGGLHEQERDTEKYWKHGLLTIAALGVENQSEADASMPLRVFSYDGADYKRQVNQRNSGGKAPFYPAVTLVLNFGPHRWSVPKTLRDCFQDLPPELEPFIPDYKLHVIDVAFLSREEVEGLKSDLYHVADFLTQTRQTGDYHGKGKRRIVHVDETLKLMNAITKDDSFLKSVEGMGPEEKEEITMSDVLEKIVERRSRDLRREYDAKLAEKDRSLAEKDRSLEETKHSLVETRQSLEEIVRENAQMKAFMQRYGLIYRA